MKVLVTQSCPTLCDSMDCSPPGPSIHGIFQARALEWGAIAFSKDREAWRAVPQGHKESDTAQWLSNRGAEVHASLLLFMWSVITRCPRASPCI